jgi:NADH:ubiquinone oxidoreductase subunit H
VNLTNSLTQSAVSVQIAVWCEESVHAQDKFLYIILVICYIFVLFNFAFEDYVLPRIIIAQLCIMWWRVLLHLTRNNFVEHSRGSVA